MGIQFKLVTEVAELEEVVQLQKQVWDAETISSMPQMVAAIHHGGVVMAAVDQGRIVGFCYGFAGYADGQTYLVSHMAAIQAEYRNRGLGKQLKEQQRQWALEHGYRKMVWTFDPLESRNAYLNLGKLGGYVRRYIRSFYGELHDPLNKGLPSDRFLVEWDLDSERVISALAGTPQPTAQWAAYPRLLNWQLEDEGPRPLLTAETLEKQTGCLVAVPAKIQDIKQHAPAVASEWRFALREVMEQAFAQGYWLTGLLQTEEPVRYYVLELKRKSSSEIGGKGGN